RAARPTAKASALATNSNEPRSGRAAAPRAQPEECRNEPEPSPGSSSAPASPSGPPVLPEPPPPADGTDVAPASPPEPVATSPGSTIGSTPADSSAVRISDSKGAIKV